MVYESITGYAPQAPVVLALGMFDGVHIGHRALLARCRLLAEKSGARAAALTFSTHPDALVSRAHPLIMTNRERVDALISQGMDDVFLLPFTQSVRQTPGDAYMRRLIRDLRVCGLVAGRDYTYGEGGKCGSAQLTALCRETGILSDIVDPVCLDGAAVSSTAIRALILSGHVAQAAKMLGEPFSVAGVVSHGRQIGRTLGFPTANLTAFKILPESGVYVSYLCYDGMAHPAVTNVGTNPTVASHGELRVETHVLGGAPDLYGRTVRVRFLDRLRGERRFDGLPALARQIENDKRDAEEWFQKHKNG